MTKRTSARVFEILDLFTPERPTWTAEEIAPRLGMAPATVYRYLRDLIENGFLIQANGRGYILGPRFIEFDRQIRLGDPMLSEGRAVMQDLDAPEIGAQLLCSFYGARVLCIHQLQRDLRITMSMERGRPFPLFLGAPSRIILANLPPYHLRSLFAEHPDTIRSVGLGDTWKAFSANLRRIRKTGYYVGSEIDAMLVGVASPVFRAPGEVMGSLCMVRFRAETGASELEVMAAKARAGAERISKALQSARNAGAAVPAYATARSGR
jgi:DNA-binding IclR family transcriptional regulator